MYNMTVRVQQVLNTAVLHVSLSETTDTGETHVLATATGSSQSALGSSDRESLAAFCRQAVLALHQALSVAQDGSTQL